MWVPQFARNPRCVSGRKSSAWFDNLSSSIRAKIFPGMAGNKILQLLPQSRLSPFLKMVTCWRSFYSAGTSKFSQVTMMMVYNTSINLPYSLLITSGCSPPAPGDFPLWSIEVTLQVWAFKHPLLVWPLINVLYLMLFHCWRFIELCGKAVLP